MRNILVINYYDDFPVRPTIWDSLYSFQRYSDCRCIYINLATQSLPEELYSQPDLFDAVIYHTTFFGSRWNRDLFQEQMNRVRPLKQLNAVTVAMPQDEFIHTDLVCNFINEFEVSLVYSLFDASEWKTIYPTVDFNQVKFRQILAGYVDEKYIGQFRKRRTCQSRPIDLGYRAWHAAYWIGRHGQKKTEIAHQFAQAAAGLPLKTDISTNEEDMLAGRKWFNFLADCKGVLGVEGGASIHDLDGRIYERTESYLMTHPDASFEQAEQYCFPGIDGNLHASVITPRHFEAILTGTCQVLLSGNYNGILRPFEHYIEVADDYSNLSDVFAMLLDDEFRKQINDRAFRDIILSGKYSYRTHVKEILRDIDQFRGSHGKCRISLSTCFHNRVCNRWAWFKIPYRRKNIALRMWGKDFLKRRFGFDWEARRGAQQI